MAELQKAGKVRWIGVSNFNVAQIQRAEKNAPVTSLQPPYSLIRRKIEEEIPPYCEKHGIGVISYAPMASGLLTGAMTRERAAGLPSDDFRSRNPEYREPRFRKISNLSSASARSARATAADRAKLPSPGSCAIPPSPAPSWGPATPSKRRASCALVN